MKNIFYVANNIDNQEMLDDEYKTFIQCKKDLLNNLKEGQNGEIMKCRYLDDDTYEYDVIQTRFFHKSNGKLQEVKEEMIWG